MRASRTTKIRNLLLAALLALLVGVTALPAAEQGRLLAIGDVHGEFDGLVKILKAANLIDDDLHWAGGDATLVQTGDFTDRGTDVRKVMDLLMSLQSEAEEAGGRMVVLQGNHEQLNLAGELRPEYVTPDICRAFIDEESEERRNKAYKRWVRWRRTHRMFPERTPEEWNRLYPLGFLEYQEAIGPEGHYGKWLRSLPVAVKIDSTVFLHGGIGPDYVVYSIDKINRLHFETQAAFDEDRDFLAQQGTILPFFSLAELNQALLVRLQQRNLNVQLSEYEKMMFNRAGQDLNKLGRLLDAGSPLWFRGYHSLPDDELSTLVTHLNEAYDTEHYVVAHTVQPSATIGQRLTGSIFLIDTGMLSTHYGGRPSALEIVGGRFTAIYPNDRTVLYEVEVGGSVLPAMSRQASPAGILATLRDLALASPQGENERQWLNTDGEPLPFQSDAEIIEFLANAPIVDMQKIPVGVTQPHKATLERNDVRAHAAFRVHNQTKERQRMADGSFVMFFKDNYFNEVAAYELGLLLDIHNIPPAVIRTHQGVEGSVQLWLENAMTDRERGGKPAPDRVRFRRQVFDMDVFDALINNLDRNQGNILWDEDWNLWMIDHTRAFNRNPKVRKPEDVQKCSRRLYSALKGLDAKAMKTAMKPYMGGFDLTALAKRHKALLKLIDEMISQKGEDEVIFDYE